MEKLEIKFTVTKGKEVIVEEAFASCDITEIDNADTGLSVDEQLDIIIEKIRDKVLEELSKKKIEDLSREELFDILEDDNMSNIKKLKALQQLGLMYSEEIEKEKRIKQIEQAVREFAELKEGITLSESIKFYLKINRKTMEDYEINHLNKMLIDISDY